MKIWISNLIILLVTIPCHSLIGQDQKIINRSLNDSLSSIKMEMMQVKTQNKIISSRLDSLIFDLSQKEKLVQEENELKRLREEAGHLSVREEEKDEDLSKKFMSGVRQQQGLNPNISMGGDFFGAVSSSNDENITEPGGKSYGNNGFYIREIELGLEAPLDPFTRGKTFISVNNHGIHLDEAYMEWLNLPLKMNLKIGVFNSEFGPLNRYHDHALPQFDRPRALVNLFGNEPLGGTGLTSSFMLPEIIFADATSIDAGVVIGGSPENTFSFQENSFLYNVQFKNFYDISQNSYFEFRLSGVTGRNPSAGNNLSYVGSLGLIYKWMPMGREKYRTLDWKTELLYSYRNENTGSIQSKGIYSSVQNKLGARFWIGARIGYSELPFDRNQHEWDYTINLDFWQSEFVFTRIQYQYNRRHTYRMETDPTTILPDDHTIILQVCWAMGPHKHEAY